MHLTSPVHQLILHLLLLPAVRQMQFQLQTLTQCFQSRSSERSEHLVLQHLMTDLLLGAAEVTLFPRTPTQDTRSHTEQLSRLQLRLIRRCRMKLDHLLLMLRSSNHQLGLQLHQLSFFQSCSGRSIQSLLNPLSLTNVNL